MRYRRSDVDIKKNAFAALIIESVKSIEYS